MSRLIVNNILGTFYQIVAKVIISLWFKLLLSDFMIFPNHSVKWSESCQSGWHVAEGSDA
jgi:hypothetical protein